VNRGGSWNNNPRYCRSANRNKNTPDNRNNNLGFRLARAQQGWWIPSRTEPIAFRPRRALAHAGQTFAAARLVLVASGERSGRVCFVPVRVRQVKLAKSRSYLDACI